MTPDQLHSLGKKIAKGLAPVIRSMAELSQLNGIRNETGLDRPLTHGDLQIFMMRRGLAFQPNGHEDDHQFL
jgi:hypothetical protein